MEKIKLSIALLLLFVLLSLVLSIGTFFIYAEAFTYLLGAALIVSVLTVVLFFFLAEGNKKEVQK